MNKALAFSQAVLAAVAIGLSPGAAAHHPGSHDSLAPMLEQVTPGVLFLCSENAPNGEILCAGAGCFARTRIVETQGVFLGSNASPEAVAEAWDGAISDETGARALRQGMEQPAKFGKMVAAAFKG